MEVTIKIPDELAAEARARGIALETYVQELLGTRSGETGRDNGLQSVRAAIDRIVEARKGNKLAGLRIKDLIHEGHKI
jgi:hypothetical protein